MSQHTLWTRYIPDEMGNTSRSVTRNTDHILSESQIFLRKRRTIGYRLRKTSFTTGMKYKLTDKRLSELVLLASVPKIVETFPDYTPSLRTIYRRLEKCGITKPRERKRNYKRTLLFSAPSYLTDREAEALIDTKIRPCLKNCACLSSKKTHI